MTRGNIRHKTAESIKMNFTKPARSRKWCRLLRTLADFPGLTAVDLDAVHKDGDYRTKRLVKNCRSTSVILAAMKEYGLVDSFKSYGERYVPSGWFITQRGKTLLRNSDI